jgi:hypothetical protein
LTHLEVAPVHCAQQLIVLEGHAELPLPCFVLDDLPLAIVKSIVISQLKAKILFFIDNTTFEVLKLLARLNLLVAYALFDLLENLLAFAHSFGRFH